MLKKIPKLKAADEALAKLKKITAVIAGKDTKLKAADEALAKVKEDHTAVVMEKMNELQMKIAKKLKKITHVVAGKDAKPKLQMSTRQRD